MSISSSIWCSIYHELFQPFRANLFFVDYLRLYVLEEMENNSPTVIKKHLQKSNQLFHVLVRFIIIIDWFIMNLILIARLQFIQHVFQFVATYMNYWFEIIDNKNNGKLSIKQMDNYRWFIFQGNITVRSPNL